MSDDEQHNDNASAGTWMRIALWGIALLTLVFYQTHQQRFGRFTNDWIFLVLGSAFIVEAVLNLRKGAASLIYATYQRSKDAAGFWVTVTINAALGGIAILLAVGDMSGLWKF